MAFKKEIEIIIEPREVFVGNKDAAVQDDIREGLERGVKELPAFFINDEPLKGKPTFANLNAAIKAALKKTKRRSPARQRV